MSVTAKPKPKAKGAGARAHPMGIPDPGTGEHTLVTTPGIALEQLERTKPRAVRPYTFQGLPRVTRAQARVLDRLEWLLPSAGAGRSTAAAISARLKELLEDDVRLELDDVEVVPTAQVRRRIATQTFLAGLAPSPQRARGLLEVELALCHASIDKLLGGSGDAMALRGLTDIEEGVMGFLVLEALKTLAPNLDPGLPRPRMVGTARTVDEAMGLLGDEQHVVVVRFEAALGTLTGFLRLFIPASFIGMTNPPGDGPERRARRRAEVTRNVGRLKAVKTWLSAEIGRAEVAASDLRGIRTGDVVLLDALTVRADRGEGGTARLRVGTGKAGRLLATVAIEDGRYQAAITGYEPGEEPKHDAGTAQDPPGESNVSEPQGEGADLLSDIPLQIAVELARIPVTAEQVVALRQGQVLELGKLPGEPVELSVNGKVVARGELVEIEGHLGVRVLSVS